MTWDVLSMGQLLDVVEPLIAREQLTRISSGWACMRVTMSDGSVRSVREPITVRLRSAMGSALLDGHDLAIVLDPDITAEVREFWVELDNGHRIRGWPLLDLPIVVPAGESLRVGLGYDR